METYLAIASKRDERRYAGREIPEDVVRHILDAGRVLVGRNSRRRFLLIETPEVANALADTVARSEALLGAPLAIVVTGPAFAAGRAAQNMMLAAWSEGVVSAPIAIRDREQARAILDLAADELPAVVVSFGYPAGGEARPVEEWLAQPRIAPPDEAIRRL